LVGSLFSMSSCRDIDSYDTSTITNFVTFTVTGGDVSIPIGSTFTDPGVVAKEGTEDETSSVTKSGSVDVSKAGVYTITYSATNKDGFSSSATRKVYVYDPNNTTSDISGTYTLADGSYRLNTTSGAKTAFSGYDVTIQKVAPGIYYMSDYIGGYYAQRAGDGSAYAMTGYFSLNNDYSIAALSGDVAGFGDSMNSLTNGLYDVSTNSVSYVVTYATVLEFHIALDLNN